MTPMKRMYRQEWVPSIFNDFFDTNWMGRAKATAPAINVIEKKDEYKVQVAAPGMTKDDFKVHINSDGNLVIDMERNKEEKKECKGECKYLRKEFAYTKYHQVLALPENAMKDEIEARVENGVLCVRIPKMQKAKEETEKRLIEVK